MDSKINKETGMKYAIKKHDEYFMVLRKLPFLEYLEYYTGRREEIEIIDQEPWLQLSKFDSYQAALMFEESLSNTIVNTLAV